MRGEYTTKPAQFRFPNWAHEFLAQEAAATGTSKTEVLVEALAAYEKQRIRDRMAQGYAELAEEMLEECREWDDTLMDGLEDDEW